MLGPLACFPRADVEPANRFRGFSLKGDEIGDLVRHRRVGLSQLGTAFLQERISSFFDALDRRLECIIAGYIHSKSAEDQGIRLSRKMNNLTSSASLVEGSATDRIATRYQTARPSRAACSVHSPSVISAEPCASF
jgi:hypothetical protein